MDPVENSVNTTENNQQRKREVETEGAKIKLNTTSTTSSTLSTSSGLWAKLAIFKIKLVSASFPLKASHNPGGTVNLA